MNSHLLSVGGRKARFLMLVFLGLAMASVPGHAVVITLNSTNAIDTFADSRNPNANFGGDALLNVGKGDGNNSSQIISFLQFDMTSLPTTASSATLNLYRYGGSGPAGTPVEAYLVTSSWSESTLTYNLQPTMLSTSFTSTNMSNGINVFYSFDITSVYNQWGAGTQTNFGIALKSNTSNGEGFDFRSTEIPNNSWKPYLDVVAVPEPATWATALVGGVGVMGLVLRRKTLAAK